MRTRPRWVTLCYTLRIIDEPIEHGALKRKAPGKGTA